MQTALARFAGLAAAILLAGCSGATIQQKLDVVAADSFRFEPSEIAVRGGQRVQITLKNDGALPHDITFEGLPAGEVKSSTASAPGEIAAHAAPKGDARLQFTPEEKGAYGFFCAVPGHREAGMRGILRVE